MRLLHDLWQNLHGMFVKRASGSRSDRLTMALALLATLIVEIVLWDRRDQRLFIPISVGLQSLGVLAIARRVSRSPSNGERLQVFAALLVGVALAALAIELKCRDVLGTGLPLELSLLVLLRNLTLVLAGLAGCQAFQWQGAALSLFLVVFATSATTDRAVPVLVFGYIVLGTWWLVNRYRQRLSQQVAGRSVREAAGNWPLGIPLAIGCLALLLIGAGGRARGPWAAWLPSSGGDRGADPRARSGVGDGDALLPASQNASTFGPVESEVFLDSETASLYDLFNEFYGEPLPQRKSERAVALPPSLAREAEQRIAESNNAGRDFSTVREPRETPSTLENQSSPALAYVSGRTPLHLRLEVFDLYDGERWQPEPEGPGGPPFRVEQVGGKPWIALPVRQSAGLVEGHDHHVLKITRLATNRIPSPSHLLGVHVDRIDRPDFFRWTHESVLGMDRESLPPGLVVHLQSRPLSRRNQARFGSIPVTMHERHRLLGMDEGTRAITNLAREWSQNRNPGYPQVQAVIDRLRSTCVLDPKQAVTGDGNSCAQFLLETRRGPDYLFASSAVLLLRSLGYSSRLVSGFYSAPGKYDASRGLTPLTVDDLHFWAEVYVGENTWLEVEPTPGYEQLYSRPDLLELAYQAVLFVWRGASRHWPWLLVGALAAAVAVRFRSVLLERLLTLNWVIFPRTDLRLRVIQTITLLDFRRRRGRPQPGCGTTGRQRFMRHLGTLPAEGAASLRLLIDCADWAAYGATAAAPFPPERIHAICREAVARLPRAAWIETPPSSGRGEGTSPGRRQMPFDSLSVAKAHA